MTVRLAKIMFRENDQESDMEYAGRMIRKVTGNMTRGTNKDVLPPEDTSSFMVNSIERCSMTESSPEGGRVGWGRQTLPKDHFCKQSPRRARERRTMPKGHFWRTSPSPKEEEE